MLQHDLKNLFILKMKRSILAIITISLLTMSACTNQEKEVETKEEVILIEEGEHNELIEVTQIDSEGNPFEMIFDNSNETVTISYKGDSQVLKQQISASGIWYTNEEYEFRGKGNNIKYVKGEEVIFEHEDDIVIIREEDKMGNTLDMTFNNSQGYVKIYLNGGEEIELEEQKSASGIWYENENYELRGKGDSYTLRLEDEIIFEN